jgi:preprotein translocase subunit SecF
MAVGFAQWGNDLYTGKRSYDIVGHRRWWFTVSGVLVLAAIVLLFAPGLNPGIEFRGGSEFVVTGAAHRDQQKAVDVVAAIDHQEVALVTNMGSDSLRVQTRQLPNSEVEQVREGLASAFGVDVSAVTSTYIGPTWGADVSKKAVTGLVAFLVLVAAVMTLYFRNWRMAVAAIIALFHDILITAGVYAAVGWEVTPATVIGFLTILGYSIYDTVVVFDKVRENTDGVIHQSRYTYSEKANLAVNQTLVRSINTSVVALLPVAGILFIGAFVLGAGTLRDIALALFVGMLVGAYSSIFLATPLEVVLREREPEMIALRTRVLAGRASGAGLDGVPVAAGAVAAPLVGPLRPGGHQGITAQPKRRRR